MTHFKIVFFGSRGRVVAERTIPCESYWDACQWGWKNMPSKAEDFHTEEASYEEKVEESERENDLIILRAFHILRKRAGLTKGLT
ncbi:hypothetical protein [Mesorhizobium sp. 131-2-1]|uniref:hypothetical protein n=1 Tax=Mesorhizobium sp. 131-2-1 TaxID=2744518 RepID=UPI0019286829|nr:hypothetical protein [Mesorhizobium sp. 131-2-1]